MHGNRQMTETMAAAPGSFRKTTLVAAHWLLLLQCSLHIEIVCVCVLSDRS